MNSLKSNRIWLLVLMVVSFAAMSLGGIIVSVNLAPPVLPVYTQPICPGDGYLWTPGYWAYDSVDGYFWVPGVWVRPPRAGVLWTPGYWGFGGGVYGWHGGYWGPHVGFYGGVNYGFGFGGSGFEGGYWSGGHFSYNTAVAHVDGANIHNTYNKTVINNTVVNNRTSFNGAGGVNARPTAGEQSAMREQHVPPTAEQVSHVQTASTNRSNLASVNHGRPANAAMSRPHEGTPAAASHASAPNHPAPAGHAASAPNRPEAAHAQADKSPHNAPHPAGHKAEPKSGGHPGGEHKS
jgi:hypothetical protein